MPDDNENKPDLLAAIRRERAKLDGLLGKLDDQALLRSARDDGWTAKDILAHLSAWEQRLLRWLERWRETGDPGRPEIGVTWDGFHSLNERDYAAAKEQPLADVRREASESHEAIVNAVVELSDDELATRPETADGPSWSWIVGANTYRHYREHRAEMEAWWEKSGK